MTERLARIPNEHARDIPARHQPLALHLSSSAPRRRKTAQAGGDPFKRNPPFALATPEHGEGHDDDLQARDQPDQREGTFLARTQSRLRWLWKTKKSLSSPALTDPKCLTSARRT